MPISPPAPPPVAEVAPKFAYQFYLTGLSPKCPIGACTLAGYSFQKESWLFDENGNHSAQPGIVMRYEFREDDKNALTEFEGKVKAEASRWMIRLAFGTDGRITRADQVFKDQYYRPNRNDVPLSNYVYLERKAAGRFVEPKTLTNEPTRLPELSKERLRKAKKDAGLDLSPDDLDE